MGSFWVYIVRCADGSYYTGVTNCPDRRAAERNEGIDRHCCTYTRRPVELVYSEEFHDPNEEIAAEKRIKGWSRSKKEALIRGDWDRLKRLSRM